MTDRLIEILGQLEEAEKYRVKNFGLEAYIPNAMQMKAHQSMARTILYCGGNRAGKSTFGAVEVAMHVTKDYPSWYPEERKFKGPVKMVISGTDFPVIQRVIEPKLFGFLPKGFYKFKRSAQGYLNRVVCQDGSTIDILTGEMKDESYESADWDYAWCDEPQNRYKYQALRRGLVDRRGRCVITFTPLTEPWMKDELVDMADGKQIDVVTVNIRDNLQDINGNPILNEEAVKEFEDSLPEDVRESRIHGKFFHLRGVVYREFCEEHAIDFAYNKQPVVAVLDPHDRNPHHVIWAFIDEDDDVYVDFEMTVHCELPDLAKKIKDIERERGYRIKKRIIDPNFGRKPAASGRNASVMQELTKHGCAFYEGNDNIELGHMRTREYLHFDRSKPVTAINKPKLFFHRVRCPITIKSIRNLQFDEWKGNTKNERDPKESPKQKDTHGADCVRYLILSRPRFSAPKRIEGIQEPIY